MTTFSTSPRLPFGLTQDQIRTDLFTAWRKDSREAPSADAYKRFRGVVDAGLREREVVLRNASMGVNFALSLTTLLTRSGVQKIDLYGNSLRDSGAEAIAHLLREAPTVTHLNLGGNDIGAPGIAALAAVLATHKKLQVLSLGSTGNDAHVNRIDPASGKVLLEACQRCKTLKWIDLSRNPLGRGSQEAFVVLAQVIATSPNIQVVKIGDTELSSDTAVALLDATRKSATISELHMHGNRLQPKVGEALASVLDERSRRNTPSTIKTLVLHSNPTLGSLGTSPLFRSLAADRGLTTLNVSGCNVDDSSVLLLCDSMDTNSTLTSLDLQNNAITAVGIAELARSVASHPALQHLNLSHNKVQDDGACALAGMLEANRVLDSLDLGEAWIGDRGAIALGVALANNTTLHNLRLECNHVSEDGGSALAALLDKNTTLLECGLRGNSIFHTTAKELAKIIERNSESKQAEVPNRLKREVVRLHYQLYKLEEARTELEILHTKKNDIERERERYDAEFRLKEADFHRQRKQLEDALREQDRSCKVSDDQLKKIQDEFNRFTLTNEAEVALLEERLAAESAERLKAEQEFARLQTEVKAAEAQRKVRMDELRSRITDARHDRGLWAEQARTYRHRSEELQEKLRALSTQLATKESTATALAVPLNSDTNVKKGKGKKASSDAIQALLGDA